ncbi:hypothetical protein OCU04_004633 [Sclerotinia nivalis]|uniref:Uncharacterized protein n=1 Tax=Sclerotinia nivalis TaxID=352851 RepID=A0A9X0AQU5_9HELO|nr:hypothetical protein OCU04_004633 [Sclerotinia nivalis]
MTLMKLSRKKMKRSNRICMHPKPQHTKFWSSPFSPRCIYFHLGNDIIFLSEQGYLHLNFLQIHAVTSRFHKVFQSQCLNRPSELDDSYPETSEQFHKSTERPIFTQRPRMYRSRNTPMFGGG